MKGLHKWKPEEAEEGIKAPGRIIRECLHYRRQGSAGLHRQALNELAQGWRSSLAPSSTELTVD